MMKRNLIFPFRAFARLYSVFFFLFFIITIRCLSNSSKAMQPYNVNADASLLRTPLKGNKCEQENKNKR